MQSQAKLIWRSPEEIVEIGFQRASVVMMNEAHDGWKRCIRTRQIGQRILPVAHQAGVQHLAMEALFPAFAEKCNITRSIPHQDEGYLAQPEMKDFIQSALDLGWTLIPYEADQFKWLSARHGIDFTNPDNLNERYQGFQSEFTTLEFTNWREEQQALNLISALQALPADTRMLVWCGNGHNSKAALSEWSPMGYCFQQRSRINQFVIDQIRTVKFDSWDNQLETELIMQFSDELTKQGGTAGFLIEEVPSILAHYHDLGTDAFLFSTQNELE
jgi:hypothetical protein